MKIHAEILKLAPGEPYSTAGLGELYLLEGKPDEAEVYATQLQMRPEPHNQILGRMILAFALALRNRHDQAARELFWVGQFLVSSGNVPVGTWDYRDLQALLPKAGPNGKAAGLLLEALTGKIALAEFTPAWAEITPTMQLS